jgi:flavin reductase (DIM6/NTAB) family NADH-FMN oxidoreductase RutF
MHNASAQHNSGDASSTRRVFLPRELSAADRYKLLIGSIVPRPIALVSTLGVNGVANVAPFSFFAGVGSEPMTLLFCPATKPDGTEKDSLRNAKPIIEGGTGEFVVNVVSWAIASPMAVCAEDLPPDESEFALSGFTPRASTVVKPPCVAESLISLECRTLQVVRTNPGVPSSGNIVIGEVVCIHILPELVSERLHIDAAKLDAIGRMGGNWYTSTRERWEMQRGRLT